MPGHDAATPRRHTTAETRSADRPGRLGGPAFERVRSFVEENLGEHLSLEELAAVAGVSRFHFARQFRIRTGESPMAYVLRSRVERAKRMLRAGGARVGEIAAALRFADQSHFTRTFRRLVGTSPGAFAAFHRSGAGTRDPSDALVPPSGLARSALPVAPARRSGDA